MLFIHEHELNFGYTIYDNARLCGILDELDSGVCSSIEHRQPILIFQSAA